MKHEKSLLADHFVDSGFQVLPPSIGIDANWHVTGNGDTCVAHCFGFGHDIESGEGLAIRVAAALNYCRGIPTLHLLVHAPATKKGRI